VAVPDPEQEVAVDVPAARLLPQLRRLDRRHEQLEGACPVHFLPHDPLDLAQHPQAEGHPGEEAGGQPADEPCAQHQLVADDLGVGGHFLEGREWQLGEAHGARVSGGSVRAGAAF